MSTGYLAAPIVQAGGSDLDLTDHEWQGTAFGQSVGGTTILTRNEAGLPEAHACGPGLPEQ
jgi:hypothetical protein